MAKANFEACLAHVLEFEGGYVNHPSDPGGETNMGISKSSYPHENIKGMTRARAAQIYRRDYWDAVSGDSLPAGLDLVAFDAAVNSGVSRGAKWLQSALGIVSDGKIGPQTIAAANAANATAVIDRAADNRMYFLRSLPTWRTFGKGWSRRVESVRDLAHDMAAAPVRRPAPRPVTAPTKSQGGIAAVIIAIIAAVAAYLGFK